jgi:hypothetical protein
MPRGKKATDTGTGKTVQVKPSGVYLVLKKDPRIEGFTTMDAALVEAKARWTDSEPTFLVHIDEAFNINLDSMLSSNEVELG